MHLGLHLGLHDTLVWSYFQRDLFSDQSPNQSQNKRDLFSEQSPNQSQNKRDLFSEQSPNQSQNKHTIKGHSQLDPICSSSIPPPGKWSHRTKEGLTFLSYTPSLTIGLPFQFQWKNYKCRPYAQLVSHPHQM